VRCATPAALSIARELHDVLAHSFSLSNVQAGVALELIDQRPEQARTRWMRSSGPASTHW
jgi:signal transduction histidine kinase